MYILFFVSSWGIKITCCIILIYIGRSHYHTHSHAPLSLSNSKGVNSNIQTVDIEGIKIELQIRLVLFVLYSNTIIIVNSDIHVSSIECRLGDLSCDYRDTMVIYGVQ